MSDEQAGGRSGWSGTTRRLLLRPVPWVLLALIVRLAALVDSVEATNVAYCLANGDWATDGGTRDDCFTDSVGVVTGSFYN